MIESEVLKDFKKLSLLIEEKDNQIKVLKEKLLIKDKEIERQDKVMRESVKSKYDKLMEKDILFHLKNRNEELERQLSDKNEEIANIVKRYDKVAYDLRELCHQKDQDKISFAVEQLEKVKEFNIQQVFSSKPLDDFIEQQISKLRGEYES